MAWRFFTLLTAINPMAKRITIGLALLLTMCASANSQTIHATFAPEKLGYGAIYEQHIFNSVSLLVSYDKGRYTKYSELCNCRSRVDIEKFGAGIRYNWAMCLIQKNTLSNLYDPGNAFDTFKVNDYSVELGGMVDFGRIESGLLYDVLNFEARISVAIKLFD